SASFIGPVRYDTTGMPDNTFSPVLTGALGNPFVAGIGVASSNAFMAWGDDHNATDGPVLAVWKDGVNGDSTPTFGNSAGLGVFETPKTAKMRGVLTLAIPDGSGYVALAISSSDSTLSIVGLTPDGNVNPDYSASGIVPAGTGSPYGVTAAVMLDDHRLIVTGAITTPGGAPEARAYFW